MRDQFFVLFLIAVLVAGCQSKTRDAEGTGDTKKSTKTSELDDSNSQPSEKLSHLDSLELKANAEPHQVCEALLKLLQKEDLANAQNLFTREATALILRFDLPLSFPGEPNATFSVSPGKFATSRQALCQVLCTITENSNGTTTDSELGWMLKKSRSGWRVCGMLLPLENDKPMDFLNFESTTDIANLKLMLTGGPDVNEFQVQSANSKNDGTTQLK